MDDRCPDCQDIMHVSTTGLYFWCDCGWAMALSRKELTIMAKQLYVLKTYFIKRELENVKNQQ